MPRLQIQMENHRGQLCFKLIGSLDLRARPSLAEEIDHRWDSCHTLCLDLSEIREIDLSGLSWLLLAESHLCRSGGRRQIVAASRPVQRAMQLLNPATRTLLGRHERGLPYRVRLHRLNKQLQAH